MPRHTNACIFTALFLLICMAATPTGAVTGREVLEKMERIELAAYIAGSVEMAAFLAKTSGNAKRSSCIMDWYFHEGNGVDQIIQALFKFKDRPVQPVIYLLMKRQCGE